MNLAQPISSGGCILFRSNNNTRDAKNQVDANLAEELKKLSMKEREKALQVIQDVGLREAFSTELNQLRFEEREKILSDLHGIRNMEDFTELENSEKVSIGLEEMKHYLYRLEKEREKKNAPGQSGENSRVAFDVAVQTNRNYIYNRKFLLMFLRSEDYDAPRAADRLVGYLKVKMDLFGPQKLCQDISLDTLDAQDVETLRNGHFQTLPVRDRSGRAIVFITPPFLKYQRQESLLRALFYQLACLFEDEETQKKGIISVFYACVDRVAEDLNRPDPVLLFQISRLNRFMPMKLLGRHLCTSDKLWAAFFSYYSSLMRKDMRMRSRVHYGSRVECDYWLSTFGIPVEKFPITASQELKRQQHHRWIAMRSIMESANTKAIFCDPSFAVPPTLLPAHSHILLGRGKPIQGHPGNQWLVRIVDSLYERYDRATKREKYQLTTYIVERVGAVGSLFLKQYEGGIWVQATADEAREKVSILFRTQRKLRHRTKTPS